MLYYWFLLLKKNLFKKENKLLSRIVKRKKNSSISLKVNISNMNTTDIPDSNTLEYLTEAFFSIAENLWNKYSKMANITKCSKAWLDKKCNRNLATYHMSRRKINWISYKKMVSIAKCIFFDNKIQEIASTNKRPFNLIN